jgi:hypothetical protein
MTASRSIGSGPVRIVVRHDAITAEGLARDTNRQPDQLGLPGG